MENTDLITTNNEIVDLNPKSPTIGYTIPIGFFDDPLLVDYEPNKIHGKSLLQKCKDIYTEYKLRNDERYQKIQRINELYRVIHEAQVEIRHIKIDLKIG